jgi:tetratricopeptide (TPR) repeat protein
MSDHDTPALPTLTAEQRRIAAAQFERAKQVIATGNHDYGIQLLLNCCKLDPGNLVFRVALRGTEKLKFNNNQHGSRFAVLTTSAAKARLKAAVRSGDYLKALEHGEQVLTSNPWDTGAQYSMAAAADALGLLDMAVWFLELAHQRDAKDLKVTRALAKLYEKRGNFTQAIALWEVLRKANPQDDEAHNKAKDLAASDTIVRGGYEQVISKNAARAAAEEEAEGEADAATDGSAAGESTEQLEPVASTKETAEMPVASDRVAREAAPLAAKVKADPTNPNAYLHLASVYRRADQFDKAAEVLRQGLGPTGNHFEVVMELAELEIEPFRRNLAVADDKLRRKPQDEELRHLRERLLKEIVTRELEIFRKKADRYPTEASHRFELGVRLQQSGQIDEAIKVLQSVRTDPRHQWKALYYLGRCFKKRNNWRLAQRNFEEALQHLPPSEEAFHKELLFQLARGCADAGDLARAVELGMELANRDFGYKDIGQLLDDWQARAPKA